MSSATNIFPPASTGGGIEGTTRTRPNPVALEVIVSVTGARPSGSGGSRDLFSEDTKTVLVFKDGAVIGLTSAVAVGQLLFLTNKHSNQEVVCQVLHKRSYKPTMCYVELQFTEEKKDFWGVAFPEGTKSDAEFKVVEQVQAEAVTADDTESPAEPHTPEAVDQLKKEVEALREQLAALEKRNAAEAAAKAAQEQESAGTGAQKPVVAPEQVQPKSSQAAPEVAGDLRVSKAKLELASVNDPSPEMVKAAEPLVAPLMPEAKDKQESPRGVVGMALPNRNAEPPKWTQLAPGPKSIAPPPDPAEALLPKPELDFSKMPQIAEQLDENHPNSIYKKFDPRRERVRVMGMSVFLVLLFVGGAWYGKWWQYLPKRKAPVAVAPVQAAKANAVPNAAEGEVRKKETQDPPLQTKGGAPARGESTVDTSKSTVSEKKAQAPTRAEENKNRAAIVALNKSAASEGGAAGNKPSVVKEKPAGKAPSKKDAAASEAAPPNVAEPAVASDAPVLPPKLLKAASPVYPPDAMLNYITGDVKAEVLVDAAGHVSEVKVISGPAALRPAAVDALKQYEYAPATQGGKGVSSRTTAVVKFWFNP